MFLIKYLVPHVHFSLPAASLMCYVKKIGKAPIGARRHYDDDDDDDDDDNININ